MIFKFKDIFINLKQKISVSRCTTVNTHTVGKGKLKGFVVFLFYNLQLINLSGLINLTYNVNTQNSRQCLKTFSNSYEWSRKE